MAEGIVEDTVEEFHAHPYIFIGGFVALALVIIYYKYKGGSSAQNFTFSYGPSDAQVLAGTQLAIAQQADTTSLAQSTLAAGTASTVYGDYFSYLTASGNNSVSINQQNTDAAVSLGNEALQTTANTNASAVELGNEALQTTANTNAANTQMAQIAGQSAIQIAQINSQGNDLAAYIQSTRA